MFQELYKKVYATQEDEDLHFEAFKNNTRTIEEHNARYILRKVSFKLGITDIADQVKFFSKL